MCKHKTCKHSIELVTPSSPLRDSVRRAVCVRRARLHAVVAAAGIASVTPLALGAAFPPVFPLASLYPAGGGDGSRGFVITGIDAGDSAGTVSGAGDVNGDGIDDLIVGANGADPGGLSGAGESYVVFGSEQSFPAVFPLESLLPDGGGDGSRGFVITGAEVGDDSGVSVSAAGDVNGDGIGDVIIGSIFADAGGDINAGESFVVFGSTQGFPAVFPLASLFPAGGGDGSRGFVINGVDVHDDSGYSVSAAGDVNGDGIDDPIISTGWTDRPGNIFSVGESYVVFGSRQRFPAIFPLANLYPAGGGDGSRGFVLPGIDREDLSGFSSSAAGDVNGDGIDDLIVGAPYADPNGVSAAGESYVVFGSTAPFPAVLPLASLYPAHGGDGSHGFVVTGINRNDLTGASVSAAGDVNADGVDDLIIAVLIPNEVQSRVGGASYVVFGSTQGFPAVFPLASLYPAGGGDGSGGFVLTGVESLDAAIGASWSVSTAGDVNGDGVADLITGANWAHPRGRDLAGASYVVFGSTQGFPAVYALSSLRPFAGGDGSRGFVLPGIDAGDQSGVSVSAAGDVNADGIDDLIVGAPGADPGGDSAAGESYVVFGRAEHDRSR